MLEIAGLMPLAQLNTSVGGPGTAPAVEQPAVTAPPPATAVAAAPATGAVTTTTAPATQPGAIKPPDSSPFSSIMSFLPIILMFVVLYFILFRGQRKEEKKRKATVATLKKGDRVMTIGGMLASVVSVEGDEVVLKIDESANVKARYRKSSIQEVIDRDEKK